MTLKHLRELLASVPASEEHKEIMVWLPGSRITLHGDPIFYPDGTILIEGDVQSGGTLE